MEDGTVRYKRVFIMNRSFRLAFILLVVLLPASSSAQSDTLLLTLPDCIRLAGEKGPYGIMARNDFTSKEASHRSFAASFYPQIGMQGNVPGYTHSINPIVLPDGTTIFTPQSEANASLNLGLTQKIPFTGGSLSLMSGLNRIDLLESRSHYYRSNPLSLSLNQPLLQINTMRWDLEAQDIRYRMATRELAEAMEDCAIDATEKFFSLLLASMNSANAALNVAINDTLYRISRGRFNVGKIAENDLLQSELAYLNAKTEYATANVGLARAEQSLKATLGLAAPTFIRLLPPNEIPSTPVNPDSALAKARGNRSDALNFDLQALMAERAVSQAKSDNFFNASMTASVGYNQRAPMLPDAYRDLLNQSQFNVGFSVPIFRWGAGSAAVDAALADRRRTEASIVQQRNSFEQEVLFQTARLNLLRDQVAVAAKSDTIAMRRFEVAKDRYLIGKIDVPILFIAQSEKDNARRANVQTLWDYWSTYFRVRRLTLFDFEAGISLVREESD
jgi:outer membrane protein TolC